MKNERNALKAGLFIVVSVALIIAVTIGIKGMARFLEPTTKRVARFDMSANVGGLSRGDEVRIGGAKVGIVDDGQIQGDAKAPGIVIVFSVPTRYVVNKDALLRIESTVTGVSVLNFESLGTGSPAGENDVIAGQGSALSALIGSGSDIAAAIKDIRTT